jgi:flagellar biosynthetic protein FliQ
MNQDTVVNLATQAMMLALKIAGPILLLGLIIGLLVSIFQAVTSIQEQSLSFISIRWSAMPRTCTCRSRR